MRLTQVLAAFVSLIASVGAQLAGKVADAVLGSIGAPKLGAPANHRPVDHGALSASLADALRPEGLHADGREVCKAIVDEANKRGDLWANTCLAEALETHLVQPLQKLAPPDSAPPAKASKKAKA